MSDKKIPGAVFIIVGSAMVLMSVFIDMEKLAMFILAGAVFIVVGFIKILIVLDEKKKHAHHKHKLHHAQHNQAAQHKHVQHQNQQKSQHHQNAQHSTTTKKDYENKTQTTSIVRCSQCGVKLHHLFKFCPNCGQKLK